MMTRLTGYIAAALVSLTTSVAADTMDVVTYQLDWLPGGDKAPIYVCVQQDFCKEAGIKIVIQPGRGSSEAITKMATNSADIGTVGLSALMAARVNENVPVTAVMSFFNMGPHAFYVPADSDITTIADLAGKSIVTSPFTASNVFLPLVLENAGLKMDDVKVIKSDPGTLAPMVLTGRADAAIAWLTNVSIFSAQAAEANKKFVALPWSDAGLELYSASLAASDKFLKERPEVAKRFIKAFKKSVLFVHENPKQAAADVVTMVPEMDAEILVSAINDSFVLVFNDITKTDGFGVFLKDKLSITWQQVAKSLDIDPASLDPETVVDRSFFAD